MQTLNINSLEKLTYLTGTFRSPCTVVPMELMWLSDERISHHAIWTETQITIQLPELHLQPTSKLLLFTTNSLDKTR